MANTETVKVIVRSRPLSENEKARGNYSIVQFDRSINQVAITDTKTQLSKTFAYDSVFDDTFTQQQVYDESAFPLVESTLQGYNSTIFAYGQTGCGKTYTMVGVPSDPLLRGIIPNSFFQIFGCIAEARDDTIFLVRCSYVEIYNEEVRDLLRYDPNTKLELKESKDKSITVKGLHIQTVKSASDIESVMENGNQHRIVKQTNMNEKSSRSHAIFTIYIETSQQQGDKQLIRAGKLNLVDLAGSERQKKTGAEGDRLKEAIKINLSLSALGNVINALVEGSHHVPYRDSKLTLLLQDSLGGNTKTLMIAVVSPADYNYDESLSTLRYASRAKFIKNKPKVNEDPKDAQLREYALEITRLKKLLEQQEKGEPIIVEKIIEKYVEVPVKRKIVKEYSDDFEDDEEFKEISKRNSLKRDSKVASTTILKKPSNLKLEPLNTTLAKNPSNIKLDESIVEDSGKVQISKMMNEIHTQLIKGGESLDKAEQERLKAQRNYQKKLRKQKKREKKLMEENKKREEEVILRGKEYENMQDELEDLRKVSQNLEAKCKAASSEVEDLNHEFRVEKDEILENFRNKQVEHEFLSAVIHNILPSSEVRGIKSRSKYDQINKKWKIPIFVIQNKSAFFPKIGGAQVRDAIQEKVLKFKEIEVFKKPQNKKKQENGYLDQAEMRYKMIEDTKSPVYSTNKFYGFESNGINPIQTEKPNNKKVFLQPLNFGKNLLENQ